MTPVVELLYGGAEFQNGMHEGPNPPVFDGLDGPTTANSASTTTRNLLVILVVIGFVLVGLKARRG